MKKLDQYLLILLLSLLACNTPPQKQKLVYCQILEKDQYRCKENITDIETKKNIEKVRRKYFLENYDAIINHCLNGGSAFTSPLDAVQCRNSAIELTLIHMAISHTELFYSEENVKLISTFILEGKINIETIIQGVRFHLINHDPCIKYKEKIIKAIKTWGIEKQLEDVKMEFGGC